ncbi:MAG: SOS response-associated peptidase, partial [Gemmatimonadetes bacterium]|nr:SOS response-associated peptidase [Gemmatimonadota bacterium]
MCGRFSLTTDPEILAAHFDLAEVPDLEPRYNIAPTQDVAVVRETARRPDGRAGGQTEVAGRRLVMMRWGLLPASESNRAVGAPLINARSETVMDKPSFREAFRHRRCLVLADGF